MNAFSDGLDAISNSLLEANNSINKCIDTTATFLYMYMYSVHWYLMTSNAYYIQLNDTLYTFCSSINKIRILTTEVYGQHYKIINKKIPVNNTYQKKFQHYIIKNPKNLTIDF